MEKFLDSWITDRNLYTGKGVYFIVRSVKHNQFFCGVLSQNSIYFRIYEKTNYMFRPL
jgi:hypothetical protein